MRLSAKIRGIKYKPLLCRTLKLFDFSNLDKALNSASTFILKLSEENKVAISWWVSPKRTRSYPYARIYDTLAFSGKKITLIPIFKDEGKDGDRDFLQFDTVSLMSLLGIYVIIAYYKYAEKSHEYENKITNQRFDVEYIKIQIRNILSYQSDALHWNLEHINEAGNIGIKALEYYERISQQLNVQMHSSERAKTRIVGLLKGRDEFIKFSRKLSEEAQFRESITIQPKENLTGEKSVITIQNYLGGCYYFTADEVEIKGDNVFLIEGKHSRNNSIPNLEDIKDGLLKMILFSNLDDVRVENKSYNSRAVLKLTAKNNINENLLTPVQKEILNLLKDEAKINNFKVILL